jgi:fructokinase
VLWDLLPSGAILGGAPTNFAFHARALGAEVSLISRVGDDDLGREIQRRCEAAGLTIDTLQVDPVAPTGTVSVELSADGQPHYTIHEHVAWDALAADDAALADVTKADAICFGSLAQRASVSRESIGVLLEAAAPAALRIFDINLRQSFYSRVVLEESLRLANVLKLNDAELPVLGEMFGLKGDDRAQLATLAERWELRAVALTRGARGALLLSSEGFSEHPGKAPPVVRDTIGAGDAFTAVLSLGLLARWPLDAINERANAVAAYVCTQSGATPELTADLLAQIDNPSFGGSSHTV